MPPHPELMPQHHLACDLKVDWNMFDEMSKRKVMTILLQQQTRFFDGSGQRLMSMNKSRQSVKQACDLKVDWNMFDEMSKRKVMTILLQQQTRFFEGSGKRLMSMNKSRQRSVAKKIQYGMKQACDLKVDWNMFDEMSKRKVMTILLQNVVTVMIDAIPLLEMAANGENARAHVCKVGRIQQSSAEDHTQLQDELQLQTATQLMLAHFCIAAVADSCEADQVNEEATSDYKCLGTNVWYRLLKDINGYCNNILWPLFHYLGLPQEDWLATICSFESQLEAYKKANQMFADVVNEHYQEGNILWCHDYHLMFLPKRLKEANPNMKVADLAGSALPNQINRLTRIIRICIYLFCLLARISTFYDIPDGEVNLFHQLRIIVGRSIFSTAFEMVPLRNYVDYCRGFYQILHLTQKGLSLNIDMSARAFYSNILVFDFVKEYLN
ncbi:alpha,alpha-trehalose-phosphate synthase [UDP-forming] 1-like protein [Tanacetum coccineum]